MKTVDELYSSVSQENLPLPHVIVNTSKTDGSGTIAFAQQIKDLVRNKSVEDVLTEVYDKILDHAESIIGLEKELDGLDKSVAGGLIFKGKAPEDVWSENECVLGYTYVVTKETDEILYEANNGRNTYTIYDEKLEPGDTIIVSKTAVPDEGVLPELIVIQKNLDTDVINCGTYQVDDYYTE